MPSRLARLAMSNGDFRPLTEPGAKGHWTGAKGPLRGRGVSGAPTWRGTFALGGTGRPKFSALGQTTDLSGAPRSFSGRGHFPRLVEP